MKESVVKFSGSLSVFLDTHGIHDVLLKGQSIWLERHCRKYFLFCIPGLLCSAGKRKNKHEAPIQQLLYTVLDLA